jgi:hypothetical protein
MSSVVSLESCTILGSTAGSAILGDKVAMDVSWISIVQGGFEIRSS